MTIKEMEALTGLTRANIRFYEQHGLLSPERHQNGYRDYTEEDLARFRQEAWGWAVSEKDRFYPETKNINLKSLERHPHKYGAHLAIFADPENDSEALLRVFWPYDSKLIYHRLCNLKEIRSEHPELAYHYILNGVYAYLKTVKPTICKAVFND